MLLSRIDRRAFTSERKVRNHRRPSTDASRHMTAHIDVEVIMNVRNDTLWVTSAQLRAADYSSEWQIDSLRVRRKLW